MPFKMVRQDITKMKVDAVVNAANTRLLMGGGVCGAIFRAAGAKKLQDVCDKLSPINTGEAVTTPGFDLPARYVIHTAGPIYSNYSPEKSEELLRACYMNSLKEAVKNNCDSIAFPLISSGIYGYPKDKAVRVAVNAITDFLTDNEISVYLAVFDSTSFIVSEKLMGEITSYIDENYVDTHFIARRGFAGLSAPVAASMPVEPEYSCSCPANDAPLEDLNEMLGSLDAGFSETLLKLIDKTGKKDSEIYKKANVDRKLFSKIRNNPDYKPSKQTALAFAFALELSLDETKDFISRAGYALTHSSKADVIVEYFLKIKNYNVFELNEVLFEFDQQLIGA